MVSISQGRGAPAQPTASRDSAQTASHDARAMSDALARARQQMATPQSTVQGTGKAPPKPLAPLQQTRLATRGQPQAQAKAQAATAQGAAGAGRHLDALHAAVAHGDDRQDDKGETAAVGLAVTQQAPPAPLTVPAAPSPVVDPSAFAQLLADLWTRENGRGAKEVSVRFGRNAWPATGARLVRNAAGALDVTLQVGNRGLGADALPDLAGRFADAGVAVGALAVEPA